MPALPEVLIVGRPNVGKSTLFNRLAGKSLALVDNQAGSTRDLKSFELLWNGVTFTVTDSGGWVPGEKESIAFKVGEKLDARIKKVSALLFVVDGQEGATPADNLLARSIRRYGIPTWLVVNKADQVEKQEEALSDFMSLGFDKCYTISSLHGIGIGELLDSVVGGIGKASSKPMADKEEVKRPLRLAILGKPNVGKSSLVNSLLGEKRQIVDDMPGTTHDAIPVIIETEDEPLIVVDTAGIRAIQKQDTVIEKLSVAQALYELQTCQVALMMVDGEKGVTHQDVNISRIIFDAFRPVVIVINKWDISHKGAEQAQAEKVIKSELRHLNFAPVLFTSAKTGLNMNRILPMVHKVYEESLKIMPTNQVNAAIQAALSEHSPPFRNGGQLKILFGHQRTGHPPAFEFFANRPECAAPAYMRHLESELRKAFGMETIPMQIVLKAKADKNKGEIKRKTFKRNFNLRAHAEKVAKKKLARKHGKK